MSPVFNLCGMVKLCTLCKSFKVGAINVAPLVKIPTGLCLLKTGFNEVSLVTFQMVLGSKLHTAFELNVSYYNFRVFMVPFDDASVVILYVDNVQFLPCKAVIYELLIATDC